MGYNVRVTAYSGDDGIDVILDGPGNDVIGVQVKRYKGSIEVEQIRAFTGALVLGGLTKGIFVTTSRFQAGAVGTVDRLSRRGYRIELMDADRFYDALKIAQRARYEFKDDPTAPYFQVRLNDLSMHTVDELRMR
jgi:restriction system protein